MDQVADMQGGFEEAPMPADRANWEFFPGEFEPAKVPPRYLFGLFLVAVGMILLPLIYFGIIAGVCWATYWYAIHAFDVFFPELNGERHFFFALGFLYLAPLCVGGSLCLFLIKAFFGGRGFGAPSVALSHLDHPVLFRYIGQLCQRMGAPIPSRIDVDISIGASAGFREGFRSMFGNDIVLRLGLPLVAGMTCREFSGIVAHELGHFTQRTAMRLRFIIFTINRWFITAVYERDELDSLFHNPERQTGFGAIVGMITRLGIGVTRGILWLLLVAGHALSSFMSRQMEFHADACAIAVAGSDGFTAGYGKYHVLMSCSERAALENRHRVTPKLPDNLPVYLATLVARCAGETQGQIVRQATRGKTRWSFSHPAAAERLAQAAGARAPGIINDDRPATVLFNDFFKLSADLTGLHYLFLNRGRPIPAERIFHVAAAEDGVPDTAAEEAIIREYFHGIGSFLRPILFDAGARLTVGLAGGKEAQIIEARRKLEGADLAGLCGQIVELDSKMLHVLQADALMHADVETETADSGLTAAEIADLAGTRSRVELQQARAAEAIEPLEEIALGRLMAALSLLRTPAMASEISNTQQLQDEVTDLLHVMGKLSVAFPELMRARQTYAVLSALLGARGHSQGMSVEEAIADRTRQMTEELVKIHAAFGSAQYPFDPPEHHRTIVDYARAKQYDADPARMACKEAESHLQGIVALYHRLLARFVEVATLVEARFNKTANASF